jgi:hypothetical protein
MGYWQYGVEQYSSVLREKNIPFALLPGDDKPDPELRGLSTINDEALRSALGIPGRGWVRKYRELSKIYKLDTEGRYHPSWAQTRI